MANRCIVTKSNGQRCRAWALSDSEYCFWHDPSRGIDRAEARRRGGRARSSSSEFFPTLIETMEDVKRLLDGTLANTLMLDNTIRRGRLLVSIAKEYRETIRAGEFETRLEQLEQHIGLRS